MKIVTTTEITSRRIADMMVGAIEGGSTYWCNSISLQSPVGVKHEGGPWYDNPAIYDHPSLRLRVKDGDEGANIYITRQGIADGLTLMAEKSPNHFTDLVSETDDAETADVFLQYVCFREIVYG